MSKNNKKNNYIDDFIDLQDNQYNYDWQIEQIPWELEHKSYHPRLQAWLHIVDGAVGLLGLAFLVWLAFHSNFEIIDNLDIFFISIIVLSGVGFILLCVQFIRRGIRQLRTIKRISKRKHRKKSFDQLAARPMPSIKAILSIIVILSIIYIITGNEKEMTISGNYKYNYPHYYFVEDHTDHGIRYGLVINLKADKLHLKLDKDEGRFIKDSSEDGDLVIRIKYRYNLFCPEKGKVVHIEEVSDPK